MGLAFKSLVEEDKRNTKSESENEDNMAMLARKFDRFMKDFRARKPTKRDVAKVEYLINYLIWLDYDFTQKEIHLKNLLTKENEKYDGSSRCICCFKFRHLTSSCPLRIVTQRDKVSKNVWVLKGNKSSQYKIVESDMVHKRTKVTNVLEIFNNALGEISTNGVLRY
ncbi:Uncharacterized protein TCM_040362 [Theobroma cacao]|uniref:Uncharacterized protein n=1 Tax=Theobroma cacao TaxID=3641 RepID=A0A061GSP2_THECC|nr:Uncharacterized protein TCM_040362 [Theobroma cacao]